MRKASQPVNDQVVHACLVVSVVYDSLWPYGLSLPQVPLFMEFSRQEYWSGLPCPPPGVIPDSEPLSPVFLTWQTGSFPLAPLGKPNNRVTTRATRWAWGVSLWKAMRESPLWILQLMRRLNICHPIPTHSEGELPPNSSALWVALRDRQLLWPQKKPLGREDQPWSPERQTWQRAGNCMLPCRFTCGLGTSNLGGPKGNFNRFPLYLG